MKRKSIVAVFLALVMSVVAVFALVGCGGGGGSKDKHAVDDSFVGCISSESYSSADSAVRAFLTEEIDGAATHTTFVDAKEGKALTAKEIGNLELGDEISVDDIDSAVYYTVTYTTDNYSGYGILTSADSDVSSYKIVVIKIGSRYYYYVPVMPNGGTLTKSYISMVCDPSKYQNVTITETSNTEAKVSMGPLGNMTSNSVITSITEITEDKVHLKIVTSMAMSMVGESEQDEATMEYYIVKVGDSLVAYYYDDDSEEWRRGGGATDYSSIEEVIKEAFKFDHSYFERTSSGFKMSEGKLEQYLTDVMGSSFEAILDMGLEINKASAEYYVKNGRLDESVVNISLGVSMGSLGTTAKATAHATYTKFGTTKITLPFSVEEETPEE
ncbi:MAG: hypothetical protein J1G04_05825 [Clostridiales bacterium]|nr:hypothetical protein [Clostridiales bacterium]